MILALALGKTLHELRSQIGSEELAHWLAFYRVEPFGPWRDDLRAAQMPTLYTNSKIGPNAEKAKLEDFMWRHEPREPEKPQTEDEIDALLNAMLGLAPPQAGG